MRRHLLCLFGSDSRYLSEQGRVGMGHGHHGRFGGRRRAAVWGRLLAIAVTLNACQGESPREATTRQSREQFSSGGSRLRQVNGNGFGNPNNIGVGRVHATQGYLFAGTWNDVEGMIVYRSRDGENFEPISRGGIDGNANNFAVVSFAWFNGRLYASSWNDVDGGSIFRANADAGDPSEIVWETISTNGMGNPHNSAHHGFHVFGNSLYAGTFNFDEGTEIWRTTTGNRGEWRQVAPKAFGDPRNTDAANMVSQGGFLYAGIETARPPFAGARIVRTDSSGRWQQVNVSGFGNTLNHNIIAMEFFKGDLYAGTWNVFEGTEIWRANPQQSGTPFAGWEKVSANGLGDPAVNKSSNFMVANGGNLYVVGYQSGSLSRGFVFVTRDGAAWEEVSGPGWSPVGPEAGAYWATVFQGRVYVAFHQGDGPGSLWIVD